MASLSSFIKKCKPRLDRPRKGHDLEKRPRFESLQRRSSIDYFFLYSDILICAELLK